MFETAPRQAQMTTFTGRTEKHGDFWVPAVTIGFEITGANTLLDLLSPTLRTTLYAPVEGQEQLPGVEPSTPILRCKDVTSVPLGIEYTGWTATIEHGIADDSAIVLGDSTVKIKTVQVFEGGTVEICGSISSSDINEAEAGLLWAKQKTTISLALKAPEPLADAIDGTVAAFNADHPGQGDLLDGDAPAQDATDAFIRSGGDEGLDAGEMPPGTHDEAARQVKRESAAAASRKRMANGGAVAH